MIKRQGGWPQEGKWRVGVDVRVVRQSRSLERRALIVAVRLILVRLAVDVSQEFPHPLLPHGPGPDLGHGQLEVRGEHGVVGRHRGEGGRRLLVFVFVGSGSRGGGGCESFLFLCRRKVGLQRRR